MFQRSRRVLSQQSSLARNGASVYNNHNRRSHRPRPDEGSSHYDPVPQPRSLDEARKLLQDWTNEPNKWTIATKRNAMNLLFRLYDSHPFAVNPIPILERWQRESGGGGGGGDSGKHRRTTHQYEAEAADVYRKFKSHENPQVASIVLTTRLQFVSTPQQVIHVASEFLDRHADHVILYANVLQRLSQLKDNNDNHINAKSDDKEDDDKLTVGDYMKRFLQDMIQRKLPINVVCFNICLRYFSHHNVNAVLEIISWMKSCQVRPDHESYTQLVHTYIHAKMPEAATRALYQIDKPTNLAEASVHVLKYYRDHVVMVPATSFVKKREAVAAATALFEQVQSRLATESKDRLLGVLIDTFVQIGDTEKAREVFQTMENPDDDKLSIMIKATIKEGDLSAAQAMLLNNKNKKQQRPITRALLNSFVDACVGTPGGLDAALHICNTVVDQDLPDIATYNALLKCANEEKPEKAVEILERLPVAPDRITYNLAMNTCYRLGQYERACHYLEAMRNDGHEPDCWTYIEVLKLLADPNDKEKYLVESIPNPNVFCYNVVLQAWVKYKRLPAVFELMNRMRNHNVEFDQNTFTCAIVAFCNSGLSEYVDRADALLNEMEQQNFEPGIVHYDSVLTAWCDLNDAAKATKVLIRRIHASTERPSLAPVAANFHQVAGTWINIGNAKQGALILLRLYDFVDQGILRIGPDDRTRRMIACELVKKLGEQDVRPLLDDLNMRRIQQQPPTKDAGSSSAAGSSSSSSSTNRNNMNNAANNRVTPRHGLSRSA